MMTFLPSSLSRYHRVILSLVPHAGHTRLHDIVTRACKQHYPTSLPSVHSEITLEIIKLAQPCRRSVDLRPYFEDCESYVHDQLTHYLDAISKTQFKDGLTKHHGVFNLSLYHQIVESAKSRYQTQVSREKARSEKEKLNSGTPFHPVVSQPLVNHNLCMSPKLDHTSKVGWSTTPWTEEAIRRLALGDNTAELVRCDNGALRLKFPLEARRPDKSSFYLYLYQHDPQIALQWSDAKPIMLSVSEVRHRTMADHVLLDVQLNDKNASTTRKDLTHYSEARTKANLRLLHEQYDPLKSSVLAKCHAQWVRGTTDVLSVFFANDPAGWLPLLMMSNKINAATVEFLGEEGITRLTLLNEIQTLLQQGDGVLLFGITKQQNELYIELDRNALLHSGLQKSALSGQTKLYRLHLSSVDAEAAAYSPSALPDHVGGEFALLNKRPTKDTEAVLKRCGRVGHLEDVTPLLTFSSATESSAETLPASDHPGTLLPAVIRHELQHFTLPDFELRQEDRFNCAITVEMKSQRRPHLASSGSTENISSKGLRVKLDDLPRWEPGEILDVTLHFPTGKHTQYLKGQPYQLVGSSTDGVVRLVYAGASNPAHIADRAIQQFIYHKRDKLTLNTQEKEMTQGLSYAVQHATSATSIGVPFFIQQGKQRWFVRAADTERNTLPSWRHYDDLLEQISTLFNQPDCLSLCLQQLNALNEHQQQVSLYIMVTTGNDGELLVSELNTTPRAILHKKQTGEDSRSFSVFRISLSRTVSLVKKHYIEELNRLKRLNSALGDEVDFILFSTVGVGLLHDVTDEWRNITA